VTTADADRRATLARTLATVQDRIAAAARDAGRDPAAVTLVVVTKTVPADDVRLLAELGVRDVGENREQELAAKTAVLADLPLRWHFVGRLQSNKAARVAATASAVHSIDRDRLLPALSRGAQERPEPLVGLVQVSLDGDPTRGGAAPDEVPALADRVAAASGLVLGGLMAVPPLTGPLADPDAAFAALAALGAAVRRDHPDATWCSAGMSGDLEAAVRHGATHVRVGTAILGPRPPRG
jgi:pyridoxal phosphate enzyme (YggS family)